MRINTIADLTNTIWQKSRLTKAEIDILSEWEHSSHQTVNIVLIPETDSVSYAVVVSTLPKYQLRLCTNRDSAMFFCEQFKLTVVGLIPPIVNQPPKVNT